MEESGNVVVGVEFAISYMPFTILFPSRKKQTGL
jgi:hypothetical protein